MSKDVLYGLWVAMVLLACAGVYSFGVSGPFIFDDFPNLSPLGFAGGVNDIPSLVNFLTTGFSGPTGRPVALLSFLVDANYWPADPAPFKRTNILIHLLCGLLLAWMILLLVKELWGSKRSSAALIVSIICLAWWVLHPLWVSTVLYVVQRMAMLATLFSVSAIIFYLKARRRLYFDSEKNVFCGWVLLICSGVCACLALLSKENAAVLSLIILLIEVVFFTHGRGGGGKVRFLVLVVLSLSALFIIYSLFKSAYLGWNVYDPRREFSVSDRFWTQGRILWVYIYDIVIPKVYTSGVFPDVVVSKGALNPASGVFGWVAIVFFLVVSALYIHRFPFSFLAIWLFFSAHIIESTVIPLEMYFEHRNYLPGIFLSLVFVDIIKNFARYKFLGMGALIAFIMLNASMLYGRVEVWSSYPAMIQVWVEKAPGSLRANLEASRVMLDEGRVQEANAFLGAAERISPNDPNVALWRLFFSCRVGLVPGPAQIEGLKAILSDAEQSGTVMQYLGYMAEGAAGACEDFSPSETADILQAYSSSVKIKGSRTEGRLSILQGIASAREGNAAAALSFFEEGVSRLGSANSGMLGVSWLARERHYAEALELLEVVEYRIEEGVLDELGIDYSEEIERFRVIIESDLAADGS